MPRYSTYPILYDDVKQLKLSSLKRDGFLNEGWSRSGITRWYFRGEEESSISITVNMFAQPHFVEVSYNFGDESRKYKINLVSMPSNLNKGVVWFFVCPVTNKRCRKLYLIDGWFAHRDAFKGFYSSQITSKWFRSHTKALGQIFAMEKAYDEIYSKHFKKTYNGKLTKRYKKLLEIAQRGDQYSLAEQDEIMKSFY